MLNRLDYPKYEPNNVYSYVKHPSKEDMPYLLEHVFNLETGDYITDSNQCCYYNPIRSNDYIVESDDESIVYVEDDNLIARDTGKTFLFVKDVLNDCSFRINVIVYNKRFNRNLMKKNLVLQKGNIIDLDYVLKHINCNHYDNCIFQQERLIIKTNDLDYLIKEIKDKISDYNNIIDAYRNDEIIYHDSLSDYYDMDIIKENGSYKVDVSVKDGFTGHIKSEIHRLQVELRDYMRLQKKINFYVR